MNEHKTKIPDEHWKVKWRKNFKIKKRSRMKREKGCVTLWLKLEPHKEDSGRVTGVPEEENQNEDAE